MELLFAIYAALAACVLLTLVALMLRRFFADRRRGWESTLSDKYLRVVINTLMSDEERLPCFPMLRHTGARLLLCEVIAELVTSTYGLDPAPLRRIVEKYGLGDHLLRRIRRSNGYQRAYYLSLVSRLPVDAWTVGQITRYASDTNSYVRFQTLQVQLSHNPAQALLLMTKYPDAFSAYEVAEVMALLQRGALPVAFEPLLLSTNRNLQAVGLALVRQFGIEEAERHLLRLAGGLSPEIGRQALYTLCALKRPLTGVAVARRINAMSLGERKALIRYMALEGYSAQVLRKVFDERERTYYESLVYSYKRCLV